jgi:hypothetical protein
MSQDQLVYAVEIAAKYERKRAQVLTAVGPYLSASTAASVTVLAREIENIPDRTAALASIYLSLPAEMKASVLQEILTYPPNSVNSVVMRD